MAAIPLELAARRRRVRLNAAAAALLGAFLLLAPDLGIGAADQRLLATTALFTAAVMGLNVVFGLAGQVTLGPAATFAVGAYVSALMAAKLDWNPFLAIPVGVAAAVLVGLVIGVPALRVGGFYLAMVTAIAALGVPAAIEIFSGTTGGEDGLLAPELSLGGTPLEDTTTYRVLIALALASALLVANIANSAWGRWFRCLKLSPVGTAALGVSVFRAKVAAFALSSFFGGLAGAVYAPYQVALSPLQFGFDLSIAFFAALVIGGLGSVWGPVLGCALYFLGPEYLLPASVDPVWQQVIFGALIVLVAVALPRGLAGGLRAIAEIAIRRSRPVDVAQVPAGEPSDSRSAEAHRRLAERTAAELPSLLTRASARGGGEPVLTARGVVKRFGQITALDRVDLTIESGRITALIGPNGSGKTTLLNVCSGYLSPDEGSVSIDGREVTARPVHARARNGLGRTFQQPITFEELAGAENVMAGSREQRPRALASLLALPSSHRHERRAAQRAESLLHALGAEHLILRRAGNISLADARILDLARALALDPTVLLLDEPAAGLDLDEIGMLESLVRGARNAGVAVLLVEHDVAFVTRLADRVVALDRGRVIADGAPGEVRTSPAVLESYFGDVEALAAAT